MTGSRTHAAGGKTPTSSPYRTRLAVLFAAAAPVAVILRRGTKKHFRLIRWSLADDTFEAGQWMSGSVHMSDLSPDGTKLIYRATQFHASARRRRPVAEARFGYDPLLVGPLSGKKKRRSDRRVPRYLRGGGTGRSRDIGPVWTAISRVPWFSALAIWPSRGSFTGGGVFLGARTIELFESANGLVPIVNVPLPAEFSIVQHQRDADTSMSALHPAWSARDTRFGDAFARVEKAGFRNVDWVTTHAVPDILFAADDCVYRLRDWDGRGSNEALSAASCIADFRDMSFEQIAPSPDALAW
jgi:hypothetical protein